MAPFWRLTYAKAKRRSFEKWRSRTLVDILRFEPWTPGWPWSPKERKWTGEPLGPEESLYVWESQGLDPWGSCQDHEGFLGLLNRKYSMDLSISMWKESIRQDGREIAIALVVDLNQEYGMEFLKKVGIMSLMATFPWRELKD